MLKKLLLGIAAFIGAMNIALAQVDVNTADQAALDGIKGIGPKTSKNILEERKKAGNFKDWADLQSRVKGIGDKSAIKLSGAGLTVNGQPLSQASKENNGGTNDAKSAAKKEKKEEKVGTTAKVKAEAVSEADEATKAKKEMKTAKKEAAKNQNVAEQPKKQ